MNIQGRVLAVWDKKIVVDIDVAQKVKVKNYMQHCSGRLPFQGFRVSVKVPNNRFNKDDLVKLRVKKKEYAFVDKKTKEKIEGWNLVLEKIIEHHYNF